MGFTRRGHDLLLKIENCPKPTVALLDGLSLGGGSELALACQAIVATPAGSLAFPETGIGIYPGLGGMLRLARQVGPSLAKYFVFTGATLRAEDALTLGIVSAVVSPAEIDDAIRNLISTGPAKKYRPRSLPAKFLPFSRIFSGNHLDNMLSGKVPEQVPAELASRTLKTIRHKAPGALKAADEIIDAQQGKSMDEAIEIELGRLAAIFASADALEGLSSLGRRRPEFKGE